MRVKKLIDSKCDQIVLKFTQRIIYAIQLCTDCHPLRKRLSIKQHQFLLQIYFALLLKYKKIDILKTELDQIDIKWALEYTQLKSLKKCSNEQIKNRLWKHVENVSGFILQYFLIKLLRTNIHDVDVDNLDPKNIRITQIVLKIWLIKHKHDRNFNLMFIKLMENANSKSIIYLCCETLYKTVSVILII